MIGKRIADSFDWFEDLSADVFWDTVTSYPAITCFAALAVVTFAVAHLPFIERLFPSIIPYTKAAALVSTMAFPLLMFAAGYRVADARDEVERLKNNLAFSEFLLDQQRQMADAADELRRKSDTNAEEAKGQLDVWREKYGDDPDAACRFTREYLDWMRNRNADRQRRVDAGASRRGLVARVRAFGEARR